MSVGYFFSYCSQSFHEECNLFHRLDNRGWMVSAGVIKIDNVIYIHTLQVLPRLRNNFIATYYISDADIRYDEDHFVACMIIRDKFVSYL